MGPKDRFFVHSFLRWLPIAVAGVIAFLVGTALLAASIYDDAKVWVQQRFEEAVALMNWWTLLAAILIGLIWLWALLVTRDRDDMSLKGSRWETVNWVMIIVKAFLTTPQIKVHKITSKDHNSDERQMI